MTRLNSTAELSRKGPAIFTMSRPEYFKVQDSQKISSLREALNESLAWVSLLNSMSEYATSYFVQGMKDNKAGRKIDLWTARIDGYNLRAQINSTIEETEKWIAGFQVAYQMGYNSGIIGDSPMPASLLLNILKGQVHPDEKYVRLVKYKK